MPSTRKRNVSQVATHSSSEDSEIEPCRDTPSKNLRSRKPNDPLKYSLRQSLRAQGRNGEAVSKENNIIQTNKRKATEDNVTRGVATPSDSKEDGRKPLRMRIRKSIVAKGKAKRSVSPTVLDKATPSDSKEDGRKGSLRMRIRKSTIAKGRAKRSVPDTSEGAESDVPSTVLKKIDDEIDCEVKALRGRTKEFDTISHWIETSLEQNSPLSGYLSGAPGTGKTATIKLILEKFKHQVSSLIVNCVSVQTQTALISTIMQSQEWDGKHTKQALSDRLKEVSKPILLVLDEIDHLVSKSNSILYSAFCWPSTISSKIILVGIANSIDLTERLLPKLKLTVAPKTLVFVPYQKDTIVSILKDKMGQDEISLDSKAVELCARKVAAMSGDLRTALHIYKATKSNTDPTSTTGGVREVLGVLNSVYASPLARAKLPFQSRLMLAICLQMSTAKKCVLTRNSLFPAYDLACSSLKLPSLDLDERRDAFSVLENQSFISVANDGKIRLMVDSKTAQAVVADSQLIEQVAVLKF